LNLITLAGT